MRFSEDKIKYGNFLYQEISTRLSSHLEPLTLVPQKILDLSLERDSNLHSLKSRYPEANCLSHDYFNQASLLTPLQSNLPVTNASIDLIYANLSLHWIDHIQQFAEWRRILRANGVVLFSAFGPNSFQEYREVWRDAGYDYSNPRFVDLHDLGDELLKKGFSEPVMEMETITLQYQSSSALVTDIRNLIGLPNGRAPDSLQLSPTRIKTALRGLRQTTVEIIYGHAFAPFSVYSNSPTSKDSVIPIIKL